MINAGGIINVSTEYLKDGDQETVREPDRGRSPAGSSRSGRKAPRPAATRPRSPTTWRAADRARLTLSGKRGRAADGLARGRYSGSARLLPAELVLAVEGVEPAGDDDRGADPGGRRRVRVPETSQPSSTAQSNWRIIERHHHRHRREAQRGGQEELADAAEQAEREQDQPRSAPSCACAVEGQQQRRSRPSRTG